MGPVFLAILIALSNGLFPRADAGWTNLPRLGLPVIGGAADYRPAKHDVTNWRWQTAGHVIAPLAFIVSVLSGEIPAAASRCVKLNNYWCIKRAGWNGEIAADSEGHVAFASAADGARTAAVLLRRYYVDFGRHTAVSIVSHWAPADCGGSGGFFRPAVGGLGGTLRARWLASHRLAGVPRSAKLRRSVVPDRVAVTMVTPTIEAGVREIPLNTINLEAVLPSRPARARPAPSSGGGSCPSEARRIANYARRAIVGLSIGVDDDLHLFDADGRSTTRLAQVMANMAAVEIGPLRVQDRLIADAVAKSDAEHAPPR